jgi:hypothetical protein
MFEHVYRHIYVYICIWLRDSMKSCPRAAVAIYNINNNCHVLLVCGLKLTTSYYVGYAERRLLYKHIL